MVNNSLNIARFYITRNPQQFQQPQDMLQKVNQAIEIISTKTNAATPTKGASQTNNNNNICNNKKKEHLKDILSMFRL